MVPALEEMGIQVLVNENTLLKRGQGTLFLAGIMIHITFVLTIFLKPQTA
jgi:hypothetical protein